MNEIKFMAWYEGKMYYNPRLNTTFPFINEPDKFVWDLEIEPNLVTEDQILMQYIEKKDITKKDIYEDDIIEYRIYGGSKRINLVVGRFGENIKSNMKDIIIIGNIYENEDLLKKQLNKN